jgi:hypothetical protein
VAGGNGWGREEGEKASRVEARREKRLKSEKSQQGEGGGEEGEGRR